jgi:hypothetical protein
VRMDAGPGRPYSLIADPSRRLLLWVDFDRRSYGVLERQAVAAAATLAGQAYRLLEYLGAQLPASDYEDLRALLQQYLGPLPADGLMVEPLGISRRVNGRDCELVSYYLSQAVTGEVCVAKAPAVHIAPKDAQLLLDASALLRELGAAALVGLLGLPVSLAALDGVPVRLQQQGLPPVVLDEVTVAELPQTWFTVPPGFQRRTLPLR